MNIEYTPEMLRKLQMVELELLIEVDRICRKLDIKYVIEGGTLLGAVRNKGFIPWDDDVDVRFLRADYDRFCEVCNTELDTERFFLQTYDTDPGYRWGYGKLLKNNTVFLRTGQDMLHMKRGIMIDLFPCDNLPEKTIEKNIYNLISFFTRKLSYSPVGANSEKNIIKRIGYKILKGLPKEYVNKQFDYLAYKKKNECTSKVRINGWGPKQESIGYDRKWMEERVELEFEGHYFFAPKDYHGFLTYMFGEDYMTPPPKNEQIPGMGVTYIDFGDGTVLGAK